MPSKGYLPMVSDQLGEEERWTVNGQHYAKTCEAWLANLDAKRTDLEKEFQRALSHSDAEIQLQKWRIFFMACAELFNFNGGEEWFVSHYRFGLRN